MKLLFDANPSHRLASALNDLFPQSTHVSFVGLSGETPDIDIWLFAKQNAFLIVTADVDFVHLAKARGTPPQIIRLDRMNYSTEAAAELIRRYAIAIANFAESTEPVLVLYRSLIRGPHGRAIINS